ncbi:hypothetical protein D9M68_742170 [compost metagenome]
MHAAGVLGDVAADRTGDLRGRVRRVVQVKRRGSLGNRQIAHTGLDTSEASGRVDFENPAEACQHQQDALFQRQRTAGQAGTGAARDHWHLTLVAYLQQGLHLLQTLGQHHQHRRGAIGRQAIAFVGFEVFLGMQHIQVGQTRSQFGQQRWLIDFGQRAVDALVVQNAHGRLIRQRCYCLRPGYWAPGCLYGLHV